MQTRKKRQKYFNCFKYRYWIIAYIFLCSIYILVIKNFVPFLNGLARA